MLKEEKEKIVKLQKPKKLLHKLVTKSETKLLRKPEKKNIADKRTYWSNGKIVLVENERKIIRQKINKPNASKADQKIIILRK